MSKHDCRCPQCGHGTLHYGEPTVLRGRGRGDVFSCRGCGSAFEADELAEIARGYVAAVASVWRGELAQDAAPCPLCMGSHPGRPCPATDPKEYD